MDLNYSEKPRSRYFAQHLWNCGGFECMSAPGAGSITYKLAFHTGVRAATTFFGVRIGIAVLGNPGSANGADQGAFVKRRPFHQASWLSGGSFIVGPVRPYFLGGGL